MKNLIQDLIIDRVIPQIKTLEVVDVEWWVWLLVCIPALLLITWITLIIKNIIYSKKETKNNSKENKKDE